MAAAGLYSMYYTTAGCVSDTGSINVTINPNPLAQIINSSFTACENDSVTLSAFTGAGYQYNWYLSGGNESEGNPSTISIQLADSGVVLLTVTDSLGCMANDTIIAHVKPLPQINFTMTDLLCEGQTIYLHAGIDSYSSGQVSGPGGYLTTQADDSIVFALAANSGVYVLTAVRNGCSDSLSQAVTVVPYPVIELGHDTAICPGAELPFDFPETYTYNWYNNSHSAEMTVTDSGWIWVMVTAGPGCSVTDSMYVQFLDCEAELPNIFTPNNDGNNDDFTVINEGVTNLEMKVYNRYGHQVFATSDPQGKWNGNDQQGNGVATGVYFYSALVENELGKKVVLHGYVHLNR
jgi:gliding motility-associated-like protein